MCEIQYMIKAINLAKEAAKFDEVPVGAIVVDYSNPKSPKIVGSAYNLRETQNSPTAHAELLAIEQASKKLKTWRLTNCVVYVTLEPCIMCAGLMHQARIKKCIFGAYDKKAGALNSLYKINEDTRLNHNFSVIGGVMEEECAKLLSEFFKNKR